MVTLTSPHGIADLASEVPPKRQPVIVCEPTTRNHKVEKPEEPKEVKNHINALPFELTPPTINYERHSTTRAKRTRKTPVPNRDNAKKLKITVSPIVYAPDTQDVSIMDLTERTMYPKKGKQKTVVSPIIDINSSLENWANLSIDIGNGTVDKKDKTDKNTLRTFNIMTEFKGNVSISEEKLGFSMPILPPSVNLTSTFEPMLMGKDEKKKDRRERGGGRRRYNSKHKDKDTNGRDTNGQLELEIKGEPDEDNHNDSTDISNDNNNSNNDLSNDNNDVSRDNNDASNDNNDVSSDGNNANRDDEQV